MSQEFRGKEHLRNFFVAVLVAIACFAVFVGRLFFSLSHPMKRDAAPPACSPRLAIGLGRKTPLQERLKTRTVAFSPATLTKENQNLAKNTRERPHFTLSGDSERLLALKRSGFLFSSIFSLSGQRKDGVTLKASQSFFSYQRDCPLPFFV